MKRQVEKSVRESLEYALCNNIDIPDEKAFLVYFAFFYFRNTENQNQHPGVLEFERSIFKAVNFPEFFTEKERLDLLIRHDTENVGFEFKFPKKSDQQPVKKRAEIYQAIGRLVYLTRIGILDRGFLICASDNEAVYSSPGSKYPTNSGFTIASDTYLLSAETADCVIHHPSYGKIWNCKSTGLLKFEWHEVTGSTYRYLSPLEITK